MEIEIDNKDFLINELEQKFKKLLLQNEKLNEALEKNQ